MSVRRTLAASVSLAFIGTALVAGPVAAHPPNQGEFLHSHHVHTGNGGCVDIDSVLFVPDTRGLHQGSNASRGPLQGPFHGSCDDRLFPGGPLLSDLGFPPHH